MCSFKVKGLLENNIRGGLEVLISTGSSGRVAREHLLSLGISTHVF